MAENNFTFIVSDESLNKYGTRVLTDGIDLTEFRENPVLFWNHKRDEDGFFGQSAKNHYPIGRWENLRIDDGKLIADAVLDLNDPTGRKVAEKIEGGFVKAASIGIDVQGYSDAPEHLVAGQTRPTITNSKLLEISIVDIPANGNALKLSYEGQVLRLDANEDIDKLNKIIPEMENNASEQKPTDIGAIVNNAVQSFFDKLKASFNLVPKEETNEPEEVQKNLFVELNAQLQEIKLETAPDNSDAIAELKASNEKLQAQFSQMQNELINLKGQKSINKPTKETTAPGGNTKTVEKLSAESKTNEAAGNLFMKKLKNR